MAVTIQSDKVSSGISKLLPLGYTQHILGTAAAPATTGANDIYQMVQLSSDASLTSGDGSSTGGPTILGITLGAADLDGGSAVTLDVGDSGGATRYISGSTVGQAGGVFPGTLAPCLGYQPFATPTFATYTTPSLQTYLILVKVNTSAATALAGNIRLLCSFTIDP